MTYASHAQTPVAPAQNGTIVRVLSYNVRHGQGVASLPSNARLARVIAGIAPTVAGLQEVWRLGIFDQAGRLGALTGLTTRYHATHVTFAGDTGNLLMTGGAVRGVELLDLGGRRERRGCLIAEIETEGVRFYFAVTHLSLHRDTRAGQLRTLAERLPAEGPLLLVGDFNCLLQELAPLRDRLTFAPDPPKTYPSLHAFSALDHVGHSGDWELVSLATVPSLASDHLPLVAELRLL